MRKNQIISLPLFINFRTDFVNKVVTPFFDIKIGYSPLGKFDKAGYASLGLGFRFWHLNISIASDALAQSIGSNGYTYSNDYGYHNSCYFRIWYFCCNRKI